MAHRYDLRKNPPPTERNLNPTHRDTDDQNNTDTHTLQVPHTDTHTTRDDSLACSVSSQEEMLSVSDDEHSPQTMMEQVGDRTEDMTTNRRLEDEGESTADEMRTEDVERTPMESTNETSQLKDFIAQMMADIKQDLGGVKQDLGGMKQKMEQNDTRLRQELGGMSEKLDRNKQEIRQDLEKMEQEMKRGVLQMSKKIEEVQVEMAEVKIRVTDLEQTSIEMKGRINTHETETERPTEVKSDTQMETETEEMKDNELETHKQKESEMEIDKETEMKTEKETEMESQAEMEMQKDRSDDTKTERENEESLKGAKVEIQSNTSLNDDIQDREVRLMKGSAYKRPHLYHKPREHYHSTTTTTFKLHNSTPRGKDNRNDRSTNRRHMPITTRAQHRLDRHREKINTATISSKGNGRQRNQPMRYEKETDVTDAQQRRRNKKRRSATSGRRLNHQPSRRCNHLDKHRTSLCRRPCDYGTQYFEWRPK